MERARRLCDLGGVGDECRDRIVDVRTLPDGKDRVHHAGREGVLLQGGDRASALALLEHIGVCRPRVEHIANCCHLQASIIFSTFTAQALNSGIFAIGSRALFVRMFAAHSAKWNGMNMMPFMMSFVTFAGTSTDPRRVTARTFSLSLMPSAFASSGLISIQPVGTSASSVADRRVMLPVCQCQRTRPVVSTNGYSASGTSAGGFHSIGVKMPRPSGWENFSLWRIGVPGCSRVGQGQCRASGLLSRS